MKPHEYWIENTPADGDSDTCRVHTKRPKGVATKVVEYAAYRKAIWALQLYARPSSWMLGTYANPKEDMIAISPLDLTPVKQDNETFRCGGGKAREVLKELDEL